MPRPDARRAAFAVCNDRIAPVFDAARRIRLVAAAAGTLVEDRLLELPEPGPDKALFLAALRVETLVCGAASSGLERLVAAYGIAVRSFVAGDADQMVRAWVEEKLEHVRFAMPGRRGRGRGHSPGEEATMLGGKGGANRGQGAGSGGGAGGGRGAGGGGGAGRGGGGGGGGRGAGGGGGAGRGNRPGPGGQCVCPQCGHTMPHQQGTPCMQMNCPECGAAMTRQ